MISPSSSSPSLPSRAARGSEANSHCEICLTPSHTTANSRYRLGFNLSNTLYISRFDGKVMALWRLVASGYQLEVTEESVNAPKNGALGAQALRIGDRFVFTSEEEMEEQKEWEEWLREEGVSGFKTIARKTKEEKGEAGEEERDDEEG
ncbi:uncharacterized protein DFL_002049 [Arthrobotrys flagrans]|uniref:Uncharacterized protein n=1 Tax=Arthrobotrys flagrans TaxID=97331 RepID=A0A437A9K2_ARTFL|nr:hypothetical protein DFL_002049 [Arthrobotrys flagrans]